MASRCDYYSDEEYQQAQLLEEQEYQKQYEEEQYQKDHYQELLNQLQSVGLELGIEHAISFLESLKKETKEEKCETLNF